MLLLGRRIGETIIIKAPDGQNIEISVSEIPSLGQARIGIDAPRDYQIYREELADSWKK